MALTVHPEFEYVKIKDLATGRFYWLAECRLSALYPKMLKKGYKGGEFEIVEKCVGTDLVNRRYVPLFPYFADWPGAFRIVADTYVTNDSGTGIVHCAPGFGEDDYRVGLANHIVEVGGSVPCPVDLNGCFDEHVPDYQGRHVKDCEHLCQANLDAHEKIDREMNERLASMSGHSANSRKEIYTRLAHVENELASIKKENELQTKELYLIREMLSRQSRHEQ